MNDRAQRGARRRASSLGLDRLHIFVPAIMSVGLAFWIVSELRELVRDRSASSRDRRASIAAIEVAESTLGSLPRSPAQRGLRPRPVYLLIAASLLTGAGYVAVGSYANHQRSGSYVVGITWLLAVALATSLAAAIYGVAALVTFVAWPTPPPLVRGILLRSALSTTVDEGDGLRRPSWRVSAGLIVSLFSAALLALIVGWSPHVVERFDDRVASWLIDHDPLAALTWLDPVDRAAVAVPLVALAALAAFRCRVLAVAYVVAAVTGMLTYLAVRPLVARPRPATWVLGGRMDSFPSGHVILSTVVAGALPLAIAVLLDRRWLIRPLRAIFGVGAAAAALHRVASGDHWPTDAIGAALIGLVLVFGIQWSVDAQRSHRLCHHCLWAGDREGRNIRGAIPLSLPAAQAVRVIAHVAATCAVVGLAVLTITKGIPSNPDGYGFGASIQTVVQLGFAGLMSVGALIAWRWQAFGAVLMAFAATGLGLFAAVEYRPEIALAMTVAMMIPAVLVWLSWQHLRRPAAIVALAIVTFGLLGATWAGANSVYESYFGPTHPESTTPSLRVDRVEWVWSGALDPHGVTVSTRLARGHTEAQLVVESVGQLEQHRSAVVRVDAHRVAKLRVDGLSADTAYTYRVLADDRPDRSRGQGSFRTPADGPTSFRVAFGSCARSGSNGAVYDAIRAEAPLMYFALGDLHYGNIESTSVGPFLGAFDSVLTRASQAALYRETPIAYVWDDHDYGPNDAGASSPGRSAARAAYRSTVPHYEVPAGDQPIYQAFTLGRVRFIFTDERSEQTADTMLGAAQLQWFLDELRRSSETHALVVWASTVPWIGEASPGDDAWAGQPDERRLIADVIAESKIDNLVMLAGDAHMLAADDGTNSDYSTAGGGGFPVLHAAALDRPGSVKGGPYSEGTLPGSGQFGLLDVEDEGGSEITLRFVGRNWKGDVLMSFERTFAVP